MNKSFTAPPCGMQVCIGTMARIHNSNISRAIVKIKDIFALAKLRLN